ncbi:MAG: 3-deoxy-D-manno-octulosonic acid transferase [Odoribacter sp.]|nr:3-deoxy-D-manno-octulosonic acid transferase [Odoribacter sp.]
MNPLYNAGIGIFKGFMQLAALRNSKIKEMLHGQAMTLDTLEQTRRRVAPRGFDVWFHAASLGEFEQGRPMIERLRREHPDYKILLTFFSPSGYRVRHDYKYVDAVAYLPLDTRAGVRKFLDAALPRRAIFIKYEFWANYLNELHHRGIPTYIISAIFRRGQRFFKPGGELFRRALRCFTHIYVQDNNSQQLLKSIGITDVTVAGDTRFDRVTDIMRSASPIPRAIERFVKDSPFTLVAGSSWQPDEEIYLPWLKKHDNVRAIIAPHEFDNARLTSLSNRLGNGVCLLSQYRDAEKFPEGTKTVIIDCFGLLSSLYRVASAAIIGGGFGSGIHNINEAAVYGIPVIFGPNNKKFKEAADLIAAGGGFEIHDTADGHATLDHLLNDPVFRENAGKAAGEYIKRSIGASDIIYKDLFPNSQSPHK